MDGVLTFIGLMYVGMAISFVAPSALVSPLITAATELKRIREELQKMNGSLPK